MEWVMASGLLVTFSYIWRGGGASAVPLSLLWLTRDENGAARRATDVRRTVARTQEHRERLWYLDVVAAGVIYTLIFIRLSAVAAVLEKTMQKIGST
jgi:hypothetical protein